MLIPIGDQLINVKEHYVLNNLRLGRYFNESVNNFFNPIRLILGKGCNLSLFVYNSVTSNNGIDISRNSIMSIESEKEVTLQNDKIWGQGTLNVTADTLTLKEGFEVTKGSTFVFHNR